MIVGSKYLQEKYPEHKHLLVSTGDAPGVRTEAIDAFFEALIKEDNVDVLFNSFKSKEQYKLLKKEQRSDKNLLYLKNLAKDQEERLNFVYRHFNKIGLIRKIAASYEMRPVYLDYCPPLVPQQILGALISSKTRRSVTSRLKRLGRLSDRSFSLRLPLIVTPLLST